MRVTIIDLDWYNRVSFVPNPICMKISSYYKQLGYNINFANTHYEFGMEYDIMYIVREKMFGVLPKEINLCDNRVNLIGKGFRFYNRYLKNINDVILSCRPDYLLYPIKDNNRLAYSEYITFYGNDGKRLKKIQDFHSAYEKVKDLIITDIDFWNKKIEDIKSCLELIKTEKNIVFSQPISLKILARDEEKQKLFLKIPLRVGESCQFISDFEEQDNLKVLKFLKELQTKYDYHSFKVIEFPIYNPKRTDIQNIEQAFVLAKMAKEQETYIILKAPNRFECALWPYYEDLEAWSRNSFKMSYVDYLCDMQGRVRKTDKIIIAQHEIYWSLPPLQNFADICRKNYSIIRNYGFIEWGQKKTEYIPFEKILRLGEY